MLSDGRGGRTERRLQIWSNDYSLPVKRFHQPDVKSRVRVSLHHIELEKRVMRKDRVLTGTVGALVLDDGDGALLNLSVLLPETYHRTSRRMLAICPCPRNTQADLQVPLAHLSLTVRSSTASASFFQKPEGKGTQ